MNKAILMGYLAKDPETRYLQGSDNAVTNFTIGVNKQYKVNGEYKKKVNFISCTAWNKTGEFVAKYFRKGSKIAISGSIETDSYEKDGKKVYTTYVLVNEAEFAEKKNTDNAYEPPLAGDGFMNIPDGIDEELPFH